MAPKGNPRKFRDPDAEDNEKEEEALLRSRDLATEKLNRIKNEVNDCLKPNTPMPLTEYLCTLYLQASTQAWTALTAADDGLRELYDKDSWKPLADVITEYSSLVNQINNICQAFIDKEKKEQAARERAERRADARAEAEANRKEDARLRAEERKERKKKKAEKKEEDDDASDNLFTSDSESEGEHRSRKGGHGADNFKLPPAKIPIFSGDFKQWQSFHDLFESCVVRRRMAGAQKMQYLLAHVTGEAKAVIDAYPVTDESFKDAWELLKSRYDNNKALFRAYYKEMTEFKGEVNESGVHARALADLGTKFITKATRLNGGKEFPWEWLLIAQLERHLNTEVMRLWDQHIQRWVKMKNAEPVVGGAPAVKWSAMNITCNEFRDFLVEHGELVMCGGGAKRQFAERKTAQQDSRKTAKSGTPYVSHTTADAAQATNSKSEAAYKCPCCKAEGHGVRKCEAFAKLDYEGRRKCCSSGGLCFTCLSSGHMVKDCPKKVRCTQCKGPHHDLMHKDAARDTTSGEQETTVGHTMAGSCTTIFTTALVEVQDSKGNWVTCRAMFDDGASPNCMTQRCVERLGLEKQHDDSRIRSITAPGGRPVEGCVRMRLRSRVHRDYVVNDTALVVDHEFSTMPARPVSLKELPFIQGLVLADPSFNLPGPIDILICNRVYTASMDRVVHLGDGAVGPIARSSRFGWFITGAVPESHRARFAHVNEHSVGHTEAVRTIDSLLEKFWTVEEVDAPKYTVKEHELCVDHFVSTHKLEGGRFTVRLPFNDKKDQLGQSFKRALTRWNSLERRLELSDSARKATNEFMKKYIDLGHMSEVPAPEIDSPAVYLPHHAVIKETSTTTKHRQVFDGSALTSSGIALNHALMVGPTEQGDLCSRLVKFRTHRVALTGDISMMYRQILVAPEDRDYQRILWRFSPAEELKHYRLNTVTYGTASAPFLAIECLRTLAREEKENHPLAARIVLSDFYVDDLVTGAETAEQAIALYDDVSALVKKGGFELRKWASNSEEVLRHIPEDLRDVAPTTAFEDSSTRTLGVKWLHAEDRLCFDIDLKDHRGSTAGWTKRAMASAIASVFDPLGLLSPVIIGLKIILQELWKDGKDWDEPVPEKTQDRFVGIYQELSSVSSCIIPRCVIPSHAQGECVFDLHGFCDASESAYGACIYIVTHHQSGRESHLLIAKTRVAPLNKLTIPRLELCAAVLLVNLYEKVKDCLSFKVRQVYAWSDNTTVLHWLDRELHRLQTFVCNRVARIVNVLPAPLWRHVRTEYNAADCASRGIMPSELAGHSLWWTGPVWLITSDSFDQEAARPALEREGDYLGELKTVDVNATDIAVSPREEDLRIIRNCGGYMKMVRVRALVERIARSRSFRAQGNVVVSAKEVLMARNSLIKSVQEDRFSREIAAVRGNNLLARKDLAKLNPFVAVPSAVEGEGCADRPAADGLLRVGGRLAHANVSVNQKYPIILPGDHQFTEALVRFYHKKSLHGGPTLLRSLVGEEFWIIGARKVCRTIVSKCIVCFKAKAEAAEQFMANLPPARVSDAPRPFTHVGVDYGGPFLVKSRAGRGSKVDKGYIALFVCFATKAIHLEFASDLSTSAFIAALHRFTSTRGLPSVIESDNGTNFVGAANEFQKIMETAELQNLLAENRISWRRITPGSPHHGGLWEAGIKQAKRHLKRSFDDVAMTFEEWMTACKRVEACLNSRPLTPTSADPEDLSVLTPGHFLTGAPLMSVPELDLDGVPMNRLDAYQRVSQRAQTFWKRWREEYLSTLQSRPKWFLKKDFRVNTAVILKDSMPMCKWKLGRIVEVFPGADGVVRSVRVKTYAGDDDQGRSKYRCYDRTVTKVCLLPFDGEKPSADSADASDDEVEGPQRGQDVPATALTRSADG